MDKKEEAGIKLTEDGGIMKYILAEGIPTSGTPKTNQEVVVHYTGTLLSGKKFDSSKDRNSPFTFVLGVGSVIRGWDIGVATMKKGEKCKLVIASNYAYGEQSPSPDIPANSALQFEIELLDFHDKKKPIMDMTPEELQKEAEERKAKGGELFKAKQLQEAAFEYLEGIKYVDKILEGEKSESMQALCKRIC